MILILTSKKVTAPKALHFLELLGKNLSSNGSEFLIASFHDIEVYISNGNVKITILGKPLDTWSTIFPRKVGSHAGLTYILASQAEKLNITFIDRFRGVTNDLTKLIQMYLFSLEGILIPKTYHCSSFNERQISNAIDFLGLPIVVKQCNTSKGKGVLLAKDRTELESAINRLKETDPRKEIILQEFIENSFEYRIFVTGTTVAVAEKKTRDSDEEFRNNVHLGAVEEFIAIETVNESILNAALAAARTTNIQVAGVDVVLDVHGNPIVFEVNSCPGFTQDEEISDEIRHLSAYLTSCEKR